MCGSQLALKVKVKCVLIEYSDLYLFIKENFNLLFTIWKTAFECWYERFLVCKIKYEIQKMESCLKDWCDYSTKIILVHSKIETILVLSNYEFFHNCDRNIGLFSITLLDVIAHIIFLCNSQRREP